jgi:hypothetical protein
MTGSEDTNSSTRKSLKFILCQYVWLLSFLNFETSGLLNIKWSVASRSSFSTIITPFPENEFLGFIT